jgi:hypothetical protein
LVKKDERDENDSDGSAQVSNSHVGVCRVSVMHARSCYCAWILTLIMCLLMMSNRLVLIAESIVKFDLSCHVICLSRHFSLVPFGRSQVLISHLIKSR